MVDRQRKKNKRRKKRNKEERREQRAESREQRDIYSLLKPTTKDHSS